MVNFAARAFITKVSFGNLLPMTIHRHHSICKQLECIAHADTTFKQHVLLAFVVAILLDN